MPRSAFAALVHPEALVLEQTVTLDLDVLEGLTYRQVNVKEAFTLQDAKGDFYRASLLEHGDRGGKALIYERMRASPESPLELTVFVGILARQRMIFVAQKAAELGATRLVPVFTEHSVHPGKALEKEKPWAWQGQGIKGSRQCRRGTVMEVTAPLAFQDVLASPRWREADARFALDDSGDPGNEVLARVRPGTRRVALFVGPEGGFSGPERDKLRASAQTLRLGGRVVRAETAVLVGLTVLQHRLGDLG